jgi:alpha-tubulin suppressor-like RCC1 family protein
MEAPASSIVLFALLSMMLAACNLAIGLEKEKLPEKADTPCTRSQDCDDGRGCTQDMCELPAGACRHYVLPEGTLCRERLDENMCDRVPEYCDGTSLDCPDDTFEPPTLECRASAGQCDEAEFCTGSSPECPEDLFSSTETTCDDEDDCTFDDRCDGEGACRGINGIFGGVQVSAGPWAHFTCALLAGDEVRCWGSNIYGQLGDETTDDRNVPVSLQGLAEGTEIESLTTGGRHVCILVPTGGIMCWGLGDSGQLGDGVAGGNHMSFTPVEVIGIPDGWRQVSGGYLYTCAVQEDDGAYCWGKNDHGQLGTGTYDDSALPVEVTGLTGVAAIKGGCYHTCAIDLSGGVLCWGRNTHGQLGNAAAGDYSLVPVSVEGISERASAVVLGTLHTCALLENGSVMCWGENEFGQLGIGEAEGGPVPVQVEGLPSTVQVIATAYEHTCAILEGGDMMCWGHNDEGQVGDGTVGDSRSPPVSVAGLSLGVVSMAPGAFHTCVVLEDTTVWCWGHNVYGEVGDGTWDSSAEPVMVVCR